jgi:hypothetical protein
VIAVVLTRLWFSSAPLSLIAGLYMILTGVGRFVEEAYRGEPQTHVFVGLRFYQWIALVTVVGGAVVTAIWSPQTPSPVFPGLPLLLSSAAFGVLTWGALGLDFPASNRRFARLA